MRLKSVMQHAFSQVPKAEIQRSTFDRSHAYKTTLDEAGYLYPIYFDEVLPGDTFTANLNAVIRMNTPLRPIMDNLVADFHFFAVPLRIIWNNFQHFMGEQVPGSLDPVGSTDFLMPTMTSPGGGYAELSLHDYFGLPTKVANMTHTSVWHRAYNKIYNDWYRDQNLQDFKVVDVDDGPDNPADYVLLKRGKRHDYFTSALPWPQKGDSVSIPLGTQAPVKGIGKVNLNFPTASANVYETDVGPLQTYGHAAQIGDSGTADNQFFVEGSAAANGNPMIYADLSTATAATINQLRQSFAVQRLYERDARGGTRYIEILKSHFQVESPDQRLQRPEYLGGGSIPIVSHHGNNMTAGTGAASLGFGTATAGPWPTQASAVARGIGFTKSFVEHCVLIGLVSIRADLTYQQGLLRPWSRSTRWDFFWPPLAHIGEQVIKNKEIFCDGSANDELVFGYQERYAEYRYKPSQVTGLFRSNAVASLDVWHLSQEFGALPVLNSSFIQESPPIDRVVAVTTEPQFIYDSYINLRCARPMPVFGVPGMIDHF